MQLLVPAKHWSDISQFFGRLREGNDFFAPMARLVDHIVRQPYAELLFATTSMHTLVIAQHSEIDWTHDVLRIELWTSETASFTFVQNRDVQTKWTCNGTDIIASFERFLQRTRWVSTVIPERQPTAG